MNRPLRTSTFVAVLAFASPLGTVGATSSSMTQFVGTTPCDARARQFVGIAPHVACDRITWQLALTEQPANYTLTATYGLQLPSGSGLTDGGHTARLHGSWSMQTRTKTDAAARVLRLTDGTSQRSAAFVRIGDSLLHLVNDDATLAVGNASWSYTLSNTAATPAEHPTADLVARSAAAKSADGSGVFEGRTPCRELAQDLGVPTPADCFKLKWRLTLLRDSGTGAPTTYKLEGTLYRQHPLEGRWTAVTDPRSNRVVYRLTLEQPATSLSFVKADENILFFLDANGAYRVGNEDFSYTLNRGTDTH